MPADLARWVLGGIVTLLTANPMATLTVLAALYAVGYVAKKGKQVGFTLGGLLLILGLLGLAWKRRRDIGTGVIVAAVGLPCLIWVVALWRYPHMRFQLVLPALLVALVGLYMPGGWLDDIAGDKTLKEAFAEYIAGSHHRVAVATEARRVSPDAKVGRARRTPDGDWRVPVAMPADPGRLEPHRVGGRVNRKGSARGVAVRPGDKLGTADVIVSERPPEPELTPWQRIAKLGVRRWPGPYTDHPTAVMRLGFDEYGEEFRISPTVPHILIAGATDAGKSGVLHCILHELAFRQHWGLILLDPDGVELAPYADRATIYAGTAKECAKVIRHLEALHERRLAKMRGRLWEIGVDGPGVYVVCDEYAAIPNDAKGGMEQWLARARKTMGRAVIATQRPERGVIPLIQRDNTRLRFALGMESDEASRMVLGISGAEEIPLSLQGAYILKNDRVVRHGRGYLVTPPAGTHADPIAASAELVTAATKSLRYTPKEIS